MMNFVTLVLAFVVAQVITTGMLTALMASKKVRKMIMKWSLGYTKDLEEFFEEEGV